MKNLILVKHPKNWGLQDNLVEELAQKALEEKGLKEDVELSVYFVGRDKAKKLNQDYRKMSYIPQVLGFPMSRIKDADGIIRLGDIVICTQKLKYEVKFQNPTSLKLRRARKSLETVLYEWMVHGVENLLK